jgi:hypothetical protein
MKWRKAKYSGYFYLKEAVSNENGYDMCSAFNGVDSHASLLRNARSIASMAQKGVRVWLSRLPTDITKAENTSLTDGTQKALTALHVLSLL